MSFDLEAVSSKAVFVLPKEDHTISIAKSTVALKDAFVEGGELTFETSGPGEQIVHWPAGGDQPKISGNNVEVNSIKELNGLYEITLKVGAGTKVRIANSP